MKITHHLRRLHQRLLPDSPDIGYSPYLWLMYLLFLLPGLYFSRWNSLSSVLTIFSLMVFLPLYFRGYWLSGRAQILNSLMIGGVGAVLLPWNGSASVYFIYAAAASGFISNTRHALVIIFTLAGTLILESWWLGLPLSALLIAPAFTLMIGSANLFHAAIIRKNASLRISQSEVSRLAAVAERERISRDLHDLLGHSLSLITLKAELAGKLMQRQDVTRASQEISDLERISRTALSEVREAVSGYRQAGLEDELRYAAEALQAADISLQLEGVPDGLPAGHDNTLAMCVREAVTNIIRHADADRCRIQLCSDAGQVRLMIADNGRQLNKAADPLVMGSGLKGMRDRVSMLGGVLDIRPQEGLQLDIRLPLPAVGVDATATARTASRHGC